MMKIKFKVFEGVDIRGLLYYLGFKTLNTKPQRGMMFYSDNRIVGRKRRMAINRFKTFLAKVAHTQKADK